MIRLRAPFLAAALFTGVAAVGLAPALAQTAPGPANSTAAPNEARHHAMARMMPGQFVDGRIAFLKAELKITRLRPFLQHHARTTDSPLEGAGFEPSVPRLPWSLVQLAARDATDAAIAKPGTPIVRVDELGERFPHPGRAFHMDKGRPRARDRLPRLRASGGAFFAFSASVEICQDFGFVTRARQIADESGIP